MQQNSGNIILTLMLTAVFLFLVSWVVKVQVFQKIQIDNLATQITPEKKLSIHRGEKLFKQENCIACHKINTLTHSKTLLQNLKERYNKDFLINYIRNEDSLIKLKNPIALGISKKYSTSGLHNKKHLSKNQVSDILNYLALYD